MVDSNVDIIRLLNEGNRVLIDNFSKSDQKIISEKLNFNRDSTEENFEELDLKKDNTIIIKNKNNENIEYNIYNNEIKKFCIELFDEDKYKYNNYYVLLTKKEIIITKDNEEFIKIEEYNENTINNLVSYILNVQDKNFSKNKKTLISNILKYIEQIGIEIPLEMIQDIISRNKIEEKNLRYFMGVIVKSGTNIDIFKFLLLNYFNNKNDELELIEDVFIGNNAEIIHILEDSFFKKSPTREEESQFVRNALIGACKSERLEILEYVLNGYSEYFDYENTNFKQIIFEAFIICCNGNNKELLEKLIEKYPESIDTIILDNKEEILQLFETIRNPEIANLLLNKFKEINFELDILEVNYFKKSVFYFALENKNQEIVKLLLNQLPNEKIVELMNAKNEYGDNITFNYKEIVKKKNMEIAKLLFSTPGLDINEINNCYYSPFIEALESNNIELLDFLINIPDVDLNKDLSIDNSSLLEHILKRNNDNKEYNKIIRSLFSNPKLEIREYCYKYLVKYLEKSKDNELNELIINHPNLDLNFQFVNDIIYNSKKSIFDYFIYETKKNNISEIILNSKKINLSNSDGLLSDYLEEKNEKMAKILLSRSDININEKNRSGETPLILAIKNEYEEIVELLLSKPDINVNAKYSDDGETALHYAIENKNKKIVELLLLQPNIDINIKDNSGTTPFHYASAFGNIEIIKLLISQQKINLDEKDDFGKTPLHYAVELGNKEVIQLLLIEKLENIKKIGNNIKQQNEEIKKQQEILQNIKDISLKEVKNKKLSEDLNRLLTNFNNEFAIIQRTRT